MIISERTFDNPDGTTIAGTSTTKPLYEPNIRAPEDVDVPPVPSFAAAFSTPPPYAPPKPLPTEPTNFRDLQTVLRQMDSNFIFPVGMPSSGKTVALYCMLRYLLTANSPGRLHPFNSPWKAVDRTGTILAEIDRMFREAKLPMSTQMNIDNQLAVTKQANYEFAPHNSNFPPLRLTFVDIAGEKYQDFIEHEKFPPGMDVFFQVGGLSLTFLLITSTEEAARDDRLFSLFLGHIAKVDPSFRNARAVVVLTKWDTYGGKDTAAQYVERWMPMTYAATRNPANALMAFTVGSVGKDSDGETEWLRQFNPAPAEALFKWIYRSITNKNLDQKPWWQRFLKGI